MTAMPPSIAAKAEALVAARRGWSGGLQMLVTTPTDVIDWIPSVISSSFYDRMDTPEGTLTGLAERFPGIEGQPGDRIRVTTDAATTPADNLAVDVPATDDRLTSDSWELAVKEGVKSIAWYDRTQIQANQDVNQLAGRKVGAAMEQRVELDLAAAAVAGRNTAVDAAIPAVTLAAIRAMRAQIPARLRRRGLVLVGADAQLGTIYEDAAVNNVGIFGDDEAIRTGQLTRPIYGVELRATDDGVLPQVLVGTVTGPIVMMFAKGMLAYGFQRAPRVETERDARARLTRHVGTMLHAEGVMESAGIVIRRIGA